MLLHEASSLPLPSLSLSLSLSLCRSVRALNLSGLNLSLNDTRNVSLPRNNLVSPPPPDPSLFPRNFLKHPAAVRCLRVLLTATTRNSRSDRETRARAYRLSPGSLKISVTARHRGGRVCRRGTQPLSAYREADAPGP